MTSHPTNRDSKLLSHAPSHSLLPSGKPSVKGWELALVGPPGRQAHVVRYKWANPVQPFAFVTLELGYDFGEGMIGVLFLPTGLHPARGIRLQVDDDAVSDSIPLRMGQNRRSMVSLDLSPDAVDTMRAGEVLNIHARTGSSGRPVIFSIPLGGFAENGDALKKLRVAGTA